MTYRKTWFSYVLWVIYTMLCAIFLVFAGNYVCVSYLTDTGPLSGRMIQALGFLTVPVTAAVYWIIRSLSAWVRRKYTGKESVRRIAEVLVVWAVFAIGIFLRIVSVLDSMRQDGSYVGFPGEMSVPVNGMEYFDMAVIREGGSPEPLAYGCAYLYVLCLSFVLTFLGNKIISAVIFQVILQIAGLVLVYAVTRRIAGVLPACTVLLYFACSVSCLEMLKNLDPECLFFVLYMIVMLAVVSYVKGYCANRFQKIQALAGAAATGVLIGLLAYLDLTAVTIIPVMAAVAIGKKRHSEDAAVNTSPTMNGTVITVTVLACVAGFLVLTGIVSLYRGTGFVMELENWAALHIGSNRTFGFKPLYPYSLDMLWFGVLAAFAAFLVFEFFRSGREQNYMLWILLCILAAPTPLAVFGLQPFGLISMYIWGVLAGLGLQNCIFGGRARLMQKRIMEINQAAEMAEEDGKPEEIPQPEQADNPAEIPQPEEAKKPADNPVGTVHAEEHGKSAGISRAKEDSKMTETSQPVGSGQQAELPQPEEAGERKEDQPPEESGKSETEAAPEIREMREDKVDETAQTERTKAGSRPRYLENPLPLPKKHVRRQMDYQYHVEEKDMKFDVDIGEDDDFDL